MRSALIIFILGFMLVLGACSNKSNKSDDIVCPPGPCGFDYYDSTIIQGSIIDQSSGEIIENVTLEFFEGSDLSTNICDIYGDSVSSITVTDGSFQVATCSDITSVTVVASAEGYLDKVANVNFDFGASEVVTIKIRMFRIDYIPPPPIDLCSFFGDETLVNDEIRVSSDVLDSTEGYAEIFIPAGVELQDVDGQPVPVCSLSIEVIYIDSQEVSIASLIPEGLNADQTTDEVLVPIGLAEISMNSDDGIQIKNFSQPITITINLPEDTEVPSQGRNVQAGDQFTVRSFDSDRLVWTTEDNDAVVGELQNGLYPANLQVDHLTIFALADPVAACNSPIEFYMTGDTVPESGLEMLISSDYLEERLWFNSYSVAISAEEARYSGFVADANELYQVTVTDYTGNTWYESDDGLSLCGNSNELTLTNSVQTVVDETLTVNLVCSNDVTVYTPLNNAIVTYRKDASSVPLVAAEWSNGVYALTQMDDSSSTYLVTIDTRTDQGVKTTTVVPDGIDESFDVEVDCIVLTDESSI